MRNNAGSGVSLSNVISGGVVTPPPQRVTLENRLASVQVNLSTLEDIVASIEQRLGLVPNADPKSGPEPLNALLGQAENLQNRTARLLNTLANIDQSL